MKTRVLTDFYFGTINRKPLATLRDRNSHDTQGGDPKPRPKKKREKPGLIYTFLSLAYCVVIQGGYDAPEKLLTLAFEASPVTFRKVSRTLSSAN